MLADRYYYNQLSQEEKRAYSALYKGIIALDKEIIVSIKGATSETVGDLFHAMSHDNPNIYYFNQTCLNYTLCRNEIRLMPQYFCKKAEIEVYNQRIQDCVNKIISELGLQQCTDLEKVKRVHDYLVRNVTYDEEALHTNKIPRIIAAHSIIGVFAKQRAVCEGIAKATKILLNTANVACIVVSGEASVRSPGRHSWNVVKIDGKAYHLDVTWDLNRSTSDFINYDYFNIPADAITKDHFDFSAPACTSWDANYFHLNNLLFDNLQQIKHYILREMTQGKKHFYFRMSGTSASIVEIAAFSRQFVQAELVKRRIPARLTLSYNNEQKTVHLSFQNVQKP